MQLARKVGRIKVKSMNARVSVVKMMIIGPLVNTFLALTSMAPDSPSVRIKQGILTGSTMTSRNGQPFFAYQGIPYAAPPIHNLRFQPPHKPVHWKGERPAKSEGSSCPRIHEVYGEYDGDEDCLYLNVYTPKLHGSDLSVMVYIHGGGFNTGSGSSVSLGANYLIDQNIVLVTFNYRLGALGFLSLGLPELPGNFGLKDQVAALIWVRDNIDRFGGNPKSVTIFGQSAGGASVHYLMLSPLARGLFHHAIAQSGSALNPWALKKSPEKFALRLASELDCGMNLHQCFMKASPKQLVQIEAKIKKENYLISVFAPVVEPQHAKGPFLTIHPRMMMAAGDIANVPLITGVTTHEGLLNYHLLGKRSVERGLVDTIVQYLALIPGLKKGTLEYREVWKKVFNFYHDIARGETLEMFLLMSSDVDFVLGVDELARGVASLQRSPVFYYQFTYEGRLATSKLNPHIIKRYGTGHGDDLPYLFSRKLFPFKLVASRNDHVMIDRMTKMWADFAKTGNPTPDGLTVSWRPVESSSIVGFLDIGEMLTMRPLRLNIFRTKLFMNLQRQHGAGKNQDYLWERSTRNATFYTMDLRGI